MKLAMVKEVLSPAGRAECLGEVPLLLLRWEDQVTAAVDLAGAQVGDRVLLAFGPTGRPETTGYRLAFTIPRCGNFCKRNRKVPE